MLLELEVRKATGAPLGINLVEEPGLIPVYGCCEKVVLVADGPVNETSPACGTLQPGDAIISVNGVEVQSAEEAGRLLADAGGAIQLRVGRSASGSATAAAAAAICNPLARLPRACQAACALSVLTAVLMGGVALSYHQQLGMLQKSHAILTTQETLFKHASTRYQTLFHSQANKSKA